MSRNTWIGITLLLAGLLVLPEVLSPALINGAIKALIAALFALAFNLLMGQGGMLSFGHGAYLGLGAFATMHVMIWVERGGSFPLPLLPLVGGAMGLLIGLVAGYFATKRTGTYFAMVTLAIAELLHSVSLKWTTVFGGEAGLSSMRMPWAGFQFGSLSEVYYLVLAWVAGCAFLLYLYTRTPFGRLNLAIRENEMRVRFVGVDPHRVKTLMFAISAMFAGIAGGLLAITDESVSYALFEARVSALIVLQSFIGGIGVFLGPAVGAASLTMFSQIMSDVSRSWLLYQGLLFIAVMLFMPNGVWGTLVQRVERIAAPGGLRSLGSQLVGDVRAALAVICAVGAIIFVVEAVAVLLSNSYAALRKSSEAVPDIAVLSMQWNPLSPLTWAVPAGLALAAFLLSSDKVHGRLWARAKSGEVNG